jgi:predicted nuclease of predicted toxin-antitoxin system
VKLIFDQNLSYRLVERLADVFPGSTHVRLVGLDRALDSEVWKYAQDNDYIIVTKDGSDFHPMSVRLGWPPKVIWFNVGNCSTAFVETQLRICSTHIASFYESDQDAMLVIGQAPFASKQP